MALTNSSYTTTSSPAHAPEPSQDSLVIMQLVCYSVILIVGSFGNLLLIVSIALERRNRSSRYFIINLACADFLTCAASIPLDISILVVGHWPFGAVMCKIVYPLQTTLISVSVSTLLCMSFERHRAIIHPFKRQPKKRTILFVCVGIWLISVLIVTPYSAILKYDGTECTENWPSTNNPKAFTMCVFLALFAIPLSIITVTYTRVGLRLRQDSKNIRRLFQENTTNVSALRNRNNVSIVKTFVCAVVAFAVCLSPFQLMWLWADFGNGRDWSHFSEALTFANLTVYANSIVNPFIFGSLAKRCRFRTGVVLIALRSRTGRGAVRQRPVGPKFNGELRRLSRIVNSVEESPRSPRRTETEKFM